MNCDPEIKMFLPQGTGYHSVDVIDNSNRHQEQCLQSASTFTM